MRRVLLKSSGYSTVDGVLLCSMMKYPETVYCCILEPGVTEQRTRFMAPVMTNDNSPVMSLVYYTVHDSTRSLLNVCTRSGHSQQTQDIITFSFGIKRVL